MYCNCLCVRNKKNYALKRGHFESPSTKTDILSFLENKRLLRENSLHQINHLPKSYRWKKMKEIDFSTLATQ